MKLYIYIILLIVFLLPTQSLYAEIDKVLFDDFYKKIKKDGLINDSASQFLTPFVRRIRNEKKISKPILINSYSRYHPIQ
jgi:hypothetical protein